MIATVLSTNFFSIICRLWYGLLLAIYSDNKTTQTLSYSTTLKDDVKYSTDWTYGEIKYGVSAAIQIVASTPV